MCIHLNQGYKWGSILEIPGDFLKSFAEMIHLELTGHSVYIHNFIQSGSRPEGLKGSKATHLLLAHCGDNLKPRGNDQGR